MQNFTFQNPVKILFGKGQIAELKNEVPKNARVLITYGGGSIKKNGVYDQVKTALKEHILFEFGGIEPNPQFSTLMKAVALVHKEKIDFILAVGGGSVIDGTKFIAAAAKFHGDAWDILEKQMPLTDAVSFGAVLTLPATGSEMNSGAVVSRLEVNAKLAFMDPAVFPKFSILDPETTYSLPEKQTVNGIIDAFVHVLEQYLTYPVDAWVQDYMAEGVLKTLIESGSKFLNEKDNYDLRANIMWAATVALNGWLSVGVPQDWATHRIGHELTAKYGLDHGRTLAIIMPAMMHIQRKKKQDKLLQYAERVWQIFDGTIEERINAAIKKTRDFFESLGAKTKLCEYDIGNEAVDAIISQLDAHGMTALGEHQDIDLNLSRKILEDALA